MEQRENKKKATTLTSHDLHKKKLCTKKCEKLKKIFFIHSVGMPNLIRSIFRGKAKLQSHPHNIIAVSPTSRHITKSLANAPQISKAQEKHYPTHCRSAETMLKTRASHLLFTEPFVDDVVDVFQLFLGEMPQEIIPCFIAEFGKTIGAISSRISAIFDDM